jgi:hypothetical protein
MSVSGPVTVNDVGPVGEASRPQGACVEIAPSREAQVGASGRWGRSAARLPRPRRQHQQQDRDRRHRRAGLGRSSLVCPASCAAVMTAVSAAVATSPNNAQPAQSMVQRLEAGELWCRAFRADVRTTEDHITWSRLYIISAEAGSPDTDANAQRLLPNQADLGDAIKPLYGDAAGAQLTSLLRDHILTAGDLIAAAKAGDTAKVTTTKDKWYANADQIADFLAKANPTNWPATEMRQMMHDHLDNTLAGAVDHLNGNAAAGIANYDKVHVQILNMADMLTDGIVAQFPQQLS